jgi:hypothetical protein
MEKLKEMRGCWKLTDEALECTLWRTNFGRGYGPVVRDYGMNDSNLRITNRLIYLRIKSK